MAGYFPNKVPKNGKHLDREAPPPLVHVRVGLGSVLDGTLQTLCERDPKAPWPLHEGTVSLDHARDRAGRKLVTCTHCRRRVDK